MKRISTWAIIALLAFSSCAKEFNYDPSEEINENAENIFGISNVNSYYWVTDVTNIQWAVPNFLTGRQINAKISVDL